MKGMSEDAIFSSYRSYLKGKYQLAKDIANADYDELNEDLVLIIFDKLVEPYSYWRKKFLH